MPAHVLVVDDSAEVREMITRVLAHAGFEVAEAADGVAALHYLAQHAPDLMILDLMMPGLNGFQVLDAIRVHPKRAGLPTIITTGTVTGRSDFRGTPVLAVLRKPFTPEGILSVVRTALARVDFDRSAGT